MICNICKGTGHGTQRPDGLCEQCLGTGYYRADADVIVNRALAERQAALLRRLRATHGKNGIPELQAIET